MILIRADANETIGTGHVMRCMAVANAIIEKGEAVIFVTADHRGDSLILSNGFKCICLETEWTHMDDELTKLQELIIDLDASLLLVDSYYVTKSYFSVLSEIVFLAYIDDIVKERWDVDVIINYDCFNKEDFKQNYSGSTVLLLGPRYAPLRKEFSGLPPHRIGNVHDIMVSAGGADPERITEFIIERLCENYPDIRFHFIVGALNQRIKEIKLKSINHSNVVLHINEKHMSDLMKNCDIAISAAGTTLYELCACGIPTITYSLADNQIEAANTFDLYGLMRNVGDCRNNNNFIKVLNDSLNFLIANTEERKRMSKKMQSLVGGAGADLIADEFEKLYAGKKD